MARRRFFNLDEAISGNEIESMMGRVVADFRLPLRSYASNDVLTSNERRHNPQDIIPSILPPPSMTTNRKDLLQSIRSKELHTSLTDYFGIDFARTDVEKVLLESRVFNRYTLKQNKQYFDQLMKDPLYSRDVRKLLRVSKGKGYFVVGFMTTEGAVWRRGTGQEHSAGFTVKAPLSLATGFLPQLDPGIPPSISTQEAQGRSYDANQVEILSLRMML